LKVGVWVQELNQVANSKKPINSLEKVYDQGAKWRAYVNNQLKTK